MDAQAAVRSLTAQLGNARTDLDNALRQVSDLTAENQRLTNAKAVLLSQVRELEELRDAVLDIFQQTTDLTQRTTVTVQNIRDC